MALNTLCVYVKLVRKEQCIVGCGYLKPNKHYFGNMLFLLNHNTLPYCLKFMFEVHLERDCAGFVSLTVQHCHLLAVGLNSTQSGSLDRSINEKFGSKTTF